MKNNMKAEFLSLSQNECLARMIASAFAAQFDPTVEELTDIRTAVSEAVTNAIIHGYMDRQGTVYMEFYRDGSEFTVVIRDTGRGIVNVELARQPFYTTMPEMERSGMGFAVMEAFMDSVEVESAPDHGTTVTMKKRIAAVSADE